MSLNLNKILRVDVEKRKDQFKIEKIARKNDSKIDEIIESIVRQNENEPSTSKNLEKTEKCNRKKGNFDYHPPSKYHGAKTMVEHKKRWTYRMACDINAAEQDGDGQMYYVADPFLPIPRSRLGGTTVVRMNYAAQRLDNRKFRSQVSTVKSIAEQESATCDKCGMRYFLPSIHMQQRISYLLPQTSSNSKTEEEYKLPEVLFECTVCKTMTKAEVLS
ncbi:unnamed protein product [Caenorhabditis angaria]|uniref:Uncharacterized protein n=1 Tax=Caenorhabditis angaria TaxID=860376 RepID=A0A9P1IKX2_9PELO|nr:unnamed protein product [Caenorhabditis angaria]